MSGGYFDYKQYQIDEIADEIENIVERETSERPPIVREEYMSAYSVYKCHGYRSWDRCSILYNTIEEEHSGYMLFPTHTKDEYFCLYYQC